MSDPGPALTLGQMLGRAAARSPDREAVVFKGERVTYAQLKRRYTSGTTGEPKGCLLSHRNMYFKCA